jgi:hypothetical protein
MFPYGGWPPLDVFFNEKPFQREAFKAFPTRSLQSFSNEKPFQREAFSNEKPSKRSANGCNADALRQGLMH